MSIPSIHQLIAGTVFTLATTLSQAALVRVDFSYLQPEDSPPAKIGLTGQFIYDDAKIGTDALVNANELKSFSFTLANDKYSVTTDLALLQAQVLTGTRFTFNYNPTQQRFVYGIEQQIWSNRSDAAPGTSFGMQQAGKAGGAAIYMRLSPLINGKVPVVVDTENVITAAGKFTYTVTAVPEPETYGMLLLGLGLIGTVLRRRPA